jgi:hypothetical protein
MIELLAIAVASLLALLITIAMIGAIVGATRQ